MFRKLLSRLLGADLEPSVAWPAVDPKQVVAQFRGPMGDEQLLLRSGIEYTLSKRNLRYGHLSRTGFREPFNARAMRIVEMPTDSRSAYRLELCSADSSTMTYQLSQRTWFGLWKNLAFTDLGPSACFLESEDRDLLKELRLKLLGGEIPEPLRNEEELWEKMNRMSDDERRSAMAALAMQSLGALDRKFNEEYPDLGPVPDELKPAYDAIQGRIHAIRRMANEQPVDADLKEKIDRFVDDSMK